MLRYEVFVLDAERLLRLLAEAPLEAPGRGPEAGTLITLPAPDGTFPRFRVLESPILEAGLAAKFPEIRTYAGRGLDDPSATLRCGWTSAGFHAQVLDGNGGSCLDPLARGDVTRYATYRRREVSPRERLCAPEEGFESARSSPGGPSPLVSGAALRIYRLALAANGEYTQFFGGVTQAISAGIVPTVNRVNGIYEREVAIRFVLVADEDQIVYPDPTTDPFTFAAGTSGVLNEVQPALDADIGDANYDVGHLVGQGGLGGVARTPCACQSGIKARGTTSLSAPTGDPFDVDFVAHELGHQLGAHHTFNDATTGSCAGNRSAAHAYEPGSGSTIMAYAGLCAGDDLQPQSDPYFHSESLAEIVAYTTVGVGACPLPGLTGNAPPTVSAGADATIPAGTPFALAAAGTDGDGDPLTFAWEQRDLGGPSTTADPDDGFGPLFRSFLPTAGATRTFPRLQDLLAGTTTPGERLPTTNRSLSFRVVVRDDRPSGGGLGTDDLTLSVVVGAGPFVVTAPVGGETWLAGAPQSVAWDVAGTDAPPIAVAEVRILFSADGGLTYPVVLSAATPNDGTQTVVVPGCAATSAGRVRVEAVGNVFFALAAGDVLVPGIPGPQVDLSLALTLLSPPPEDLRDVGLGLTVDEACAPPVSKSLAVHSDEADDLVLTPDATFAGGTLSLRAERDAAGGGRIYLVVGRAEDTRGLVRLAKRAVVVPRLRSVRSLTALLVRASDAELALSGSSGPPPGFTTLLEEPLP